MPGCHNLGPDRHMLTLTDDERNVILGMVTHRAPNDKARESAISMFNGFTGSHKDINILAMIYAGIASGLWPWSEIE